MSRVRRPLPTPGHGYTLIAGSPRLVSRRSLLAAVGGAVGGAALLAACGSDGATGSDGTALAPETTLDGYGLVQRFPNLNLFTPGEVRLPVSLTDGQNLLTAGPDVLTGWIETFDGERVAEVSAPRRSEGIAIPYWEVRATLDRAVIHTLRLEGDDGYGATFEVWDVADVRTPSLGAALPALDTPTVDDHRGVEPYCSRTPDPCPLHDVTLAEALQQGVPVAFVVGTPAHCQTGACGPGLDFLVAEHERLGATVTMVHADVYADAAATTSAPVIEQLHLDYEPVLYLAGATGIIVDRLDGVWDASELRDRLDALLA
ncbi:MAG: hypothetical protein ACO3C1_10220 [Ilumatobacteraceae bacterium]